LVNSMNSEPLYMNSVIRTGGTAALAITEHNTVDKNTNSVFFCLPVS